MQNKKMNKIDFVKEARSYLNTPFVHAGRSKFGMDCVGLITVVANELGIMDYDNIEYGGVVEEAVLKANIERYGYEIPFTEIDIGDTVLLGTQEYAHHVAIVTSLNPLSIIHASPTIGKVVEHRFDERWMKKLISVYRWLKWEEF